MPCQQERLKHLKRIARAVLGVGDVRIRMPSTAALPLRGAPLDPPAVTVHNQSGKCGDAVEVLTSSRRLGLSVRQTKRYPPPCRWQDLVDMSGELVAYQAQPHVVRAAQGRPCVTAVVSLRYVVMLCLELPQANMEFKMLPSGEIIVILCTDATPLWRTSSMQCDV